MSCVQKGGKTKWPPVCREKPHPRVDVLWARGRQAGVPAAGRAQGGEMGGSGPPVLTQTSYSSVASTSLQPGQWAGIRAASRDTGKDFSRFPKPQLLLAVPVHICSCSLGPPPALSPQGAPGGFHSGRWGGQGLLPEQTPGPWPRAGSAWLWRSPRTGCRAEPVGKCWPPP